MKKPTKTKTSTPPPVAEEIRIVYTPLSELRRAARNPKKHDEKGIAASMTRHGFVDPIVWDEFTNAIAAGHGRLDELLRRKQAGKQPPRRITVRESDGEWLAPVVRGVSLGSAVDFEAYLIASNRLVEKGGWDEGGDLVAMLREISASPDRLAGTGFSDADLQKMLRSAGGAAGAGSRAGYDDDDEVLESKKPLRPQTQAGDVWHLGRHRLVCGDSLDAPTRALVDLDRAGVRLVLTDPPYAIYGSSTGIGSDIADDAMVRPFFEAILKLAHELLPVFGHAYLCCDWRTWPAIWESARRASMSAKNCIVWDKGGQGLGSSYANCYELVGFFAKLPVAQAMKNSGQKGQRMVHRPNLIEIPRVTGADRKHNAAKPPDLFAELMNNSSDPGDLVVDLFVGGGTAIVVAEAINRTCFAFDKDPGWCDVVVDRWQRASGGLAELERPGVPRARFKGIA